MEVTGRVIYHARLTAQMQRDEAEVPRHYLQEETPLEIDFHFLFLSHN